MTRLILLTSVLLWLTPTAIAYNRPRETPSAFVTIAKARIDANRLAAKIAHQDDASSFRVTICKHPGRASAVDCKARLRFVDSDGTTGYARYVVHVIATRGGRWAEIVPA